MEEEKLNSWLCLHFLGVGTPVAPTVGCPGPLVSRKNRTSGCRSGSLSHCCPSPLSSAKTTTHLPKQRDVFCMVLPQHRTFWQEDYPWLPLRQSAWKPRQSPGGFTQGLGLRQTQGQTTGQGSSRMLAIGQCRSPLTAVGLEDLRLDDLVTGAAHHEVEVVVCWVVAKQVHICGGKGKQVVLKKQPSLRRWMVSSWNVLQGRFSNKTGRKAIIFRKGNAACANAAPYSQSSPCLQEALLISLANGWLPLMA